MIFFVLSINLSWAQNTFSSSSNSITNNSGHISYTLGQSFTINMAEGSDGYTFGGIQQPYYLYTLGINPGKAANNGIRVFPNPVQEILYLSDPENSIEKYTFRLSGIHGEKLMDFRKIRSINMKMLPDGLYILTVYLESTPVKSFSIIKKS